jgi:hypothetical protein
MSDLSVPEAIALGVAVLLALALVSVLANMKMAEGGLPPERRGRVLTSLWLLLAGLLVLLFALRLLAGGPVIGGSPTSGGLWLGLHPRQLAALGLAVVLLILGTLRLRAILQPLEFEGPSAPDLPDDDSQSDHDT